MTGGGVLRGRISVDSSLERVVVGGTDLAADGGGTGFDSDVALVETVEDGKLFAADSSGFLSDVAPKISRPASVSSRAPTTRMARRLLVFRFGDGAEAFPELGSGPAVVRV